MVWGAFCVNGVLTLVKITAKMNSKAYQKVREDHLIPNASAIAGQNWTFQQDNASIHASRSTKAYLGSANISTFEWPACYSDLNPIENLWGIVSRRVYKDCRQFKTIDELWECVQRVWTTIEQVHVESLVSSMKNRIFEVINLNGSQTKY